MRLLPPVEREQLEAINIRLSPTGNADKTFSPKERKWNSPLLGVFATAQVHLRGGWKCKSRKELRIRQIEFSVPG